MSLKIGIPKGRIEKELTKQLIEIDLMTKEQTQSRQLVMNSDDMKYQFVLLKPKDIPTYVANGVLDIGYVGKDTLTESKCQVYELETFDFATCRLCICGYDRSYEHLQTIRIATKYPVATKRYFKDHYSKLEIIYLNGSVELAPILGLSDIIVDIVETGATLKANGLKEIKEIDAIYPVLIANQISYKTKKSQINVYKEKLRQGKVCNL